MHNAERFSELLEVLFRPLEGLEKHERANLTAQFLSESDFRSLVPAYIRKIAKVLGVKIHEISGFYRVNMLPDEMRLPLRKCGFNQEWISEPSLRTHFKAKMDALLTTTSMGFKERMALVPIDGVYVKWENDVVRAVIIPYDTFIVNATVAEIAPGDGVTAEPFWKVPDERN